MLLPWSSSAARTSARAVCSMAGRTPRRSYRLSRGTTRDYVARRTTLGDRVVILIDTAGVEPIGDLDGLLAAAQATTQSRQQQAAPRSFCIDATRPLTEWEASQLRGSPSVPRLVVVTKSDVGRYSHLGGGTISTSSVSGLGLPELRQAIHDCLADDSRNAVTSTALAVTRACGWPESVSIKLGWQPEMLLARSSLPRNCALFSKPWGWSWRGLYGRHP